MIDLSVLGLAGQLAAAWAAAALIASTLVAGAARLDHDRDDEEQHR